MIEFTGRSATYVLPGKPTPLARARHSARKVWDSQKAIKFTHGTIIRSQHTGNLFNGPLEVKMEFYFPFPRARAMKTRGISHDYHVGRPDCDNCIKYILDIANGILYGDDSIVCRIIATKFYDLQPRTVFTITEL